MRLFLAFVAVELLFCGPSIFAKEADGKKAFTATTTGADASIAPIIIASDPTAQNGDLQKAPPVEALRISDEAISTAAKYLREGMQKMTGQKAAIESQRDISQGIVLCLLSNAPPEIKDDPETQEALRNTGKDAYNSREAFYIRSDSKRVLIVANTAAGLTHGVVELLESVGYEVLGMGPNWIHVPDYKTRPLAFDINTKGLPGFYLRRLVATSGQARGHGTLFRVQLSDPADETVDISYGRWWIGARMGQSMGGFPGHAMQAYHQEVFKAMAEGNSTEGFLMEAPFIGAESARPPASKENAGRYWINNDVPSLGKIYYSDGKQWSEASPAHNGTLDLSAPITRNVVFEGMKRKSEEAFGKDPDAAYNFPTDSEDGSLPHGNLASFLSHPNWYREYLASENVEFGKDYVLHGFKGLNQPKEMWDLNSASDMVFGFNNWLLRQYDKWIDSLPEKDRFTASGKSKKEMIRCSLASYNFHDVPPNFNLDSRIRVIIAGFPKHRGYGKWKNLRTPQDMAGAFKIMLPREPSGNYHLLSFSYYKDSTIGGIAGSQLAPAIQKGFLDEYNAGFRAYVGEIDFNFGKYGLAYYLYSKMLWNPQLTASELDAVRDRWFQRSFGSAWQKMKAYYDFMAPENLMSNGPNNLAKAILLLDAAGKSIDGNKEPDAQRRIDDLKQFWYYYYLVESGQAKLDVAAMREFIWKAQMSYITSMQMLQRMLYKGKTPSETVGSEFNAGPAHYTHEETEKWWAKIKEFWPLKSVTEFNNATLANGIKGKDVDVNDVVRVQQFNNVMPSPNVYSFHSGYQKANFLTLAKEGEEIGFKLIWPFNPDDKHYRDRDVFYGISYWNSKSKQWEELVDITMTSTHSALTKGVDGKEYQLAEVRYASPKAGIYRIDTQDGGYQAQLTSLDGDSYTGAGSVANGMAFFSMLQGLRQSGIYFYIPKGTKSIDLEKTTTDKKVLRLHRGLPSTGLTPTRTVDLPTRDTYSIPLEPGEDGSFALLEEGSFVVPYFYSVPMLWAKSPSALMVPREIAKADGLTIIESSKNSSNHKNQTK